MSLEKIYAPTMAYWIKWGNILTEREKKQKEHEIKWIKRREEEWKNYWEEQSTQFGEWEVEEAEQEGMKYSAAQKEP